MLRSSATSRHQLPQAQLRAHQQLAPEEEAEVEDIGEKLVPAMCCRRLYVILNLGCMATAEIFVSEGDLIS